MYNVEHCELNLCAVRLVTLKEAVETCCYDCPGSESKEEGAVVLEEGREGCASEEVAGQGIGDGGGWVCRR